MIASLRGTIQNNKAGMVILDVHGVGYEVKVPITVTTELAKEKNNVFLFIHTHVKESTFELYGFLGEEDKYVFQKIISISGIGPRIGLSVLSTMTVEEFRKAIEESSISQITKIPGIGKKTAMRMIVELKEKLPPVEASINSDYEDALSALINLGYKKNEAQTVLDSHYKDGVTNIEHLLKESLKSLAKT